MRALQGGEAAVSISRARARRRKGRLPANVARDGHGERARRVRHVARVHDERKRVGAVGGARLEALAQVLKQPELREKLAVEAVEPMPMTPQQFGEFIRKDIARWTAIAKEHGIRLDT